MPATKKERWDLYHAIAASHPLLHETLLSVASRIVFLRYGPSREDIELFRLVAAQAASASDSSTSDVTADAAPDDSRARWRALLQHAHIHFDFTMLLHRDNPHGKLAKGASNPPALPSEEAAALREPAAGEEPAIQGAHWESYLADVRAAVLSNCPCLSVTAFCAYQVPPFTACTLLRRLAQLFPALTHLYLRFDWEYGQSHTDAWLFSGGHFPAVRFLRLAAFPACGCTPAGPVTHRQQCVGPRLLRLFPGVRHLHLDAPVFLKLLDPPHALETVTLEAPPKAYIAGREPYATIMDYNVAAALRRGFLRWPDRDRDVSDGGGTKTIVVRTGTVDPLGFEAAKAACEEYGIVLKKEVVYF